MRCISVLLIVAVPPLVRVLRVLVGEAHAGPAATATAATPATVAERRRGGGTGVHVQVSF
jgi:hypothetical protein